MPGPEGMACPASQVAGVVCTTSLDKVGDQEYLRGVRKCLYYTPSAIEVACFLLSFSFLVSLILWPG